MVVYRYPPSPPKFLMSVLGTSESIHLKNQFCPPSRTAIHSQIKALLSTSKESVCQCRRCKSRTFNSWVGKIPWSRKSPPDPIFLPGKSHGQRSLVGYSPWGGKESDLVTKHTHNFSISMLKGLLPGQLFCFQTSSQQIPHITLTAGPCLPHLSLLQPLPWFPACSRSSWSSWCKVVACEGGLGRG